MIDAKQKSAHKNTRWSENECKITQVKLDSGFSHIFFVHKRLDEQTIVFTAHEKYNKTANENTTSIHRIHA